MQNRAELMDVGYAILNWFVDSVLYYQKLTEKARLPSNYKRNSLLVFIALTHSTFPAEKALNLDAARTHWGPIFNAAILDWHRRKGGKRTR